MGQEVLVGLELEDGETFIKELARSGFDVTVAFWLHNSDSGYWDFYIASTLVDEIGSLEAYQSLNSKTRTMPAPRIESTYDVRLIRPSDPLAQEALQYLDGYQSTSIRRFRPRETGGVSIDAGFLYPRVQPSETRF
jgi:hypothetical protein